MNTEDFKSFKYPGKEKALREIFEKQGKLLKEYLKIEKIDISNFDINTLDDQQILKDFLLIRVVEELCEAQEAKINNNRQHFLEEITDAFNFLVESYIIYGWTEKDLKVFSRFFDLKNFRLNYYKFFDIKDPIWEIIYRIGLACNKLKNRLWRQNQYLVDLLEFEKRFKIIWDSFNAACISYNISLKILYQEWSKKYRCNLFRLKTKY